MDDEGYSTTSADEIFDHLTTIEDMIYDSEVGDRFSEDEDDF